MALTLLVESGWFVGVWQHLRQSAARRWVWLREGGGWQRPYAHPSDEEQSSLLEEDVEDEDVKEERVLLQAGESVHAGSLVFQLWLYLESSGFAQTLSLPLIQSLHAACNIFRIRTQCHACCDDSCVPGMCSRSKVCEGGMI
jgi:hypothetical protein